MNPKQVCFACMRELPAEGTICPFCGHDNRFRGNGPGFLKSSVLGGQYLTGRVLGRGGFGITYLGLDLFLNRKVAIKEYFPEGVVHRDEETQGVVPFGGFMEETFKKGVSRAVREARTAAQLEDIPNTVRIYSVLEANNTVYIVMEYIDGITLTAYVQQAGGKISWVRAWPIIEPMLDTLSRVHARGIVHRDVSPDNIMIRYSDTSPVLLDFGTARDITTGNTEHSISLRMGFSPMEMYTSSGAIDQRSDEYAVMATLYYMLTGKKPESPLNVAAGLGAVEKPSRLGSDIPSGEGSAEEVLMRGLECRMEDRYPSIEELRQAFHRALEQGATMFSPPDAEFTSTEKKWKNNEKQTEKKESLKYQDEEESISHEKENIEDSKKTTPQKKTGSKPVLTFFIIVMAAVAVFLVFFPKWKRQESENLNKGVTHTYKKETGETTTATASSMTESESVNTSTPTLAPEDDDWKCENCGAVMDKENRFCEECGLEKGKWRCENCEAVMDDENRFCEECGVEKGKWKCENCGAIMNNENKFCEECGTEKGKWKCTNCGAVMDRGDQFCEECSTKRDADKNKQ